jgi:hypothetical protein
MPKGFALAVFLCALPGMSRADKIIMKDGKIYEGHIMGESSRSILISNPPLDPRPRFIELRDVMTIVRERRPAEKPSPEEGRFASISAGLSGQVYSSRVFNFSPAPGLYFGGGFRIHPLVELGGEFNFIPSLTTSALSVTDGVNTRSYESFYAYHGGFSVKFFPCYTFRQWRAEPYLTAGYHWSRLVPKGSGDAFEGYSPFGGAGVMIPWWKPLYWDFRFTYDHTNYDSIHFLGGDGGLSGVTQNSCELSVGLSYRFL